MNFKRMNVLLIMLALVLLVGIGSVSAASDDGADIISDSITDDMLLDDGVTENTDPSDPTEPGDSTEPVAEKINTTVGSENVTARDNETASISVAVKDNESKNITVAENDFSVSEGDKSLNFTYNGTINLVDKLDLGNHTLIIAYLGNDTYAASNTTITLSIFGNETLNAPDTVIVDKDGKVEIPITVTNGVNETAVTQEKLTITLTKEGVDFTDAVVEDSIIKFNIGNEFTNAVLTVVYNENNYTKTIVIKKGSNVTVENETINFNITDHFIIPVNITDLNSNGLTVNKSDIVVSEGNKILNFTYADSNITITSNLTAGVHNITITYKGNDTYSSSKMNIIVNVRGEFAINTNVTSIDVNSTKKGEFKINNISNGVDFKEFTKDDLNITVSYKDGNQTKSINVTSFDLADGVISFVLENGNFTNATLTISYNNGEVVSNITLHRIYNARIEVINNENDFLSGNFTYKLIDIDDENEILANKSVTFVSDELFVKKVGTNTSSNPIRVSAQTDSEGILNFKNSNLKPVYYADFNGSFVYGDNFNIGTHNVTLKAGDNLKFDDFKTNVTINKLSIIITPKAFSEYYGTDKKFQIEVRNARTNELVSGLVLKLDIPQTTGKTYYVSTNDDGIGEIGVNKLVGGTYNVGITNNDTDNINSTVNNTTLTIKKIPVKIDTSSKTMYYNSGSTAKIKITNSKTGKAVAGVYVLVRLYTSSTKYNDYLFMTNSKGIVEFSAPLNVGKHKMIVATADTRYEGSSVTKTITVKNAPAKITAAKKTAYYKQGKYFVVKVTNTKNNKPIYNAKLNIRVFVTSTKYYNFNGRTGANGQIKLSMDLKPGTYNVVIIDKDSNMVAKQATSKMVIKKAPAKFSAPKVTAKKKANKYFKVKVINKKTKKIIPGVKVKVKVYTGKKSKTYTIKTNSKGIAKLSTKSLKVGNHKVVITSANKYVKASKKTSSIKITK